MRETPIKCDNKAYKNINLLSVYIYNNKNLVYLYFLLFFICFQILIFTIVSNCESYEVIYSTILYGRNHKIVIVVAMK